MSADMHRGQRARLGNQANHANKAEYKCAADFFTKLSKLCLLAGRHPYKKPCLYTSAFLLLSMAARPRIRCWSYALPSRSVHRDPCADGRHRWTRVPGRPRRPWAKARQHQVPGTANVTRKQNGAHSITQPHKGGTRHMARWRQCCLQSVGGLPFLALVQGLEQAQAALRIVARV